MVGLRCHPAMLLATDGERCAATACVSTSCSTEDNSHQTKSIRADTRPSTPSLAVKDLAATKASSSLTQPKEELHGRLYYRDQLDLYPYPCDEAEKERLDALHHTYYDIALSGRLHLADLPSHRPLRILDVGCGTGIWALSMAARYPSAHITAIDLDASWPELPLIDLGVRFVFGVDFTSDNWSLPEDTLPFDFIHMGLLCGSVPNWTALFRKAHSLLRPGGQIESVEFDWTPRYSSMSPLPFLSPSPSSQVLSTWWSLLNHSTTLSGRPIALPSSQSMSGLLLRAGLKPTARYAVPVPTAENMSNPLRSSSSPSVQDPQYQNDDHDHIYTFENDGASQFEQQDDLEPDASTGKNNALARWHRYTTFHPSFKTLRGISMVPLTRGPGAICTVEEGTALCGAVNRVMTMEDSGRLGIPGGVWHRLCVVTARKE